MKEIMQFPDLRQKAEGNAQFYGKQKGCKPQEAVPGRSSKARGKAKAMAKAKEAKAKAKAKVQAKARVKRKARQTLK